MTRIVADIPIDAPPSWAVWERRLLDSMNQSVQPFLDHFTREDGEFIWKDEWGGGSPDDYYEPFFNWPLVYLIGGADHMLALAERQWEAVTRQLTRLGTIHKEYGIREDQMHQSESDIFFYHLCLANPTGSKRRERARRFAGFYLNEDPDAINYNAEHRIVLSGLNGSQGAYYAPESEREKQRYAPLGGSMERYSLPFFDLPGIASVQDLGDPENARRMGQALFDRWRRGDTPTNLSITSLVTNAFLLTGEEKYRAWVVEYTDGWVERAKQNDGLLPDNVGLSGQVGEYLDGKWYGGRYGWTFPHGFLTLQKATLDAAANAYLLTRDAEYLQLPRRQMDRILELGEIMDIRDHDMSVSERWTSQFASMGGKYETFLVPYRYGDAGWFDWQPISPVYLVTLWNLSMSDGDWERLERVRLLEAFDWDEVFPFHNKEDSGHEQPWVRYLMGENPAFPDRSLHASHQMVCRRLAQLREDEDVGTLHHIHHWQWANPVSSESLIQLTLGGPQPIYNGGLLHVRLRYFDVRRRRPGLPEDVGALVEKLEARRTVVRLVNLSPTEAREVLIQAGAFGEHRFGSVKYAMRTSEYPGWLGGYEGSYASPPLATEDREVRADNSHLTVTLPPGLEITLDMETERYANEPSYSSPL
ncbi:MAG: hypothetical protein CME15_14560 [Gemmatimonadetes bacterium]|jgi:hypothetical protein|nr:hypothetical protein [Gemmatimonadota bacterium]